jgi:polar amino acid transport system substrate-binding protein
MRAVFLILSLLLMTGPKGAAAQSLTVTTVERPPFSMRIEGKQTGFSMELWEALAKMM